MSRAAISRSLVAAALALLGATGCIGDADVDGDADPNGALEVVPEDVWVLAPAGCEGVSWAGLSRAPVEGAPGLGALVAHGPDGRRVVRCVDSDAALRLDMEVAPLARTAMLADDPSPQPSVDAARGYDGEVGGGADADPTPTPLTEEDPTPTPMNQGTEEDPTPTPMQPIWLIYSGRDSGGVHGDPTPTPMTNPTDDDDGTDEDPTPTPMLPIWLPPTR